jgi:hypothetical protein
MTAPTDVSVETRYTPATASAPVPVPDVAESRWHPATLIVFRFAFVYFGVYVLLTQMLNTMILIPRLGFPQLGGLGPLRGIVMWVGAHVLGIAKPFSSQLTGSGDMLFDWVQAFTLLLGAVLATMIWTAVARERTNHAKLYAAFRVFVRFALGTTMLSYGFAKVVPLQMSAPGLTRLLEPFGEFSPMGVLWASIGASRSYEMITGAAEVTGGLLVMIPQTTKIGAILCFVDTADVFALNMTYDVPVKLFAVHLVLMSLLLIAPDARRLVNFFLRGRADRLTTEPTLGGSRQARIRATGLQLTFATYYAIVSLWGSLRTWHQFGGGAPKSPLYGIWDVQRMTIDGVERAPLLTDSTRWRRVLFDAPGFMQIRRMTDGITGFVPKIDTVAHTMALKPSIAINASGSFVRPDESKPPQTLAYTRPERTHLVIDGALDGHTLHVELAYRDPNAFMLRSRGFHWVQERPFNR